ncbi:G2/M cyclins accumulate steadily during G2 and are abruptly destroyed at mitosis-like protein [Bombardia bombarda]|uniref:G2/M cyclins accumulate steadily during G2 and are abruptly destroyed at mitosis-like protein n=1 Tax=Bombardia bombarda TaxID=252184 RepID=A0AA39X6E8_9PEZI|nr:G2/M cyclins accumulate steadily during G2 and are abruptly destroyed at mitosis-like protein [Bombardia bombarda]
MPPVSDIDPRAKYNACSSLTQSPQKTRITRAVTNENDENSTAATTRMTRAKAATLNVDELAMPTKALQSKKIVAAAAAAPARKRAALGDLSNVPKADAVADGKKPVTKAGLVSKAAHPSGIQKRTTTTARQPLATKPANNKAADTNRKGAGSISGTKRRVAATATVVKDEVVEEGEPVRKRIHAVVSETKVSAVDIEKKAKPETMEEALARKDAVPVQAFVEPAEHVYPKGVKNLDSEDIDDPLMVAEYATEIFEYLRDLECSSIPNPQYMSHQDDLEWKTRGILIDWLIEVHTRFHLLPETLFLAVNIIDRFLSEKVVQLDRLQLVGITAMFIASKYEEVLSPHIANFRHVADDGFSESEILSAERFILSTLNYDLSYPNPMNFLRRISKADNYDIQSRTIAKYLMEISLLDHRFMAYRPSHIAAGAMYLSRLILDRGEWNETIEYYAGFTEEEIEPVFQLMIDYLARPVVHEAFFKKYASKKFLKASILTRQWAKKNAQLYGVLNTELSLDQIS